MPVSELQQKIVLLHHLPAKEIAHILGCNARGVRKVLERWRSGRPMGRPTGARNPAWRGGRMVDLDGYVLTQTKPTRVLEHRQVAAQMLGRPLLPEEVVDHVDGITIHNAPHNLRVFASNGEHLRATISGRPHDVSLSGQRNISAQKKGLVGSVLPATDTYRLRKERGDVRLRAILRAALELGTEHPCLSGTQHWLEQNGIDPRCGHSLKRAWAELCQRYAEDLLR